MHFIYSAIVRPFASQSRPVEPIPYSAVTAPSPAKLEKRCGTLKDSTQPLNTSLAIPNIQSTLQT